MTESQQSSGWVTVNVDFRIGGEVWHAEAPVPEGPASPVELLPVLQAMADAVTDAAAREVAAGGAAITCRKGCGACCRQLVPIAPSEVTAIREVVDRMPAARKSTVLARFQEVREGLESAGLLGMLLEPERFTEGELKTLGLEYFRLGIPCPFLEEEACSIHPDRPLSCREYLVTSPADLCAQPGPDVQRIPLPAKVSTCLLQIEAAPGARMVRWIPLGLALEAGWSQPEPSRTGPELLQEVFGRLAAGTGSTSERPIRPAA
jgi:Fe-S-cluster containining protein